ncbi:Protein of unknown function [Collimonas sp. OK242]|uniref:DUF2971 domain-containing protein n=1 Tax=Collimonas sp. OK242 TaxID=1798195 RepID=UPI00089CC36C|nr:DUF2971 domain-containing protein [Collimonas sp. OK242]SDX58973.1 Protein of unknown function [Collimonas sp. OK242]
MKTNDEIFRSFDPLWADIQNSDSFPAKRPLLAHYTSISTLECIMANDEIWLSNPLYMNDMEELRFGILEGARAFRQNEAIKTACGNSNRYNLTLDAFEAKLKQFSEEQAFDIYVFCLSEHDAAKNSDGRLSMWRGYGSNGNGAAIIFDTAKLNYLSGSPLIIANVTYASGNDRCSWIDGKLTEFANLLVEQDIPDDKLHIAVGALFERIKIFSIFTKHHGFSEEQEWRMVYLRERDHQKHLSGMLHYAVGKNGIEPKLKYKILPIEGATTNDLSLEKVVHQIILGPSISNPLAVSSVKRMLETVKKSELSNRVIASTTPFRA